jgi:ATP-dependent DNA helicase RecQ
MITSSDRASRDGQRPPPQEPEHSVAARDPVDALAFSRLGIGYLYPVQRFVVANVIEGHPQIVILPTGAGKSLCFQLPALLLPRPTLVLMPLLSLLSDQMRKLSSGGVPVACLRGGLPVEEKRRLWDGLQSGAIRLVLATPEACLAEPNLSALRACHIGHLVVDEAHCVSEWGDTFRPAYKEVGRLARELGIVMISAFTATASREVIARIKDTLFGEGEVRVVAGGADRPGITYAVQPILSRGHALANLAMTAEKPLLVFCHTRNDTERAAREMRATRPELPVRFYHAGLSREERSAVEEWFLSSHDGALTATCAYGLGVDKPDIRTVAHIDVPQSVEAYLQESGRAGRDGNRARAVLLVSRDQAGFADRIDDPVSRQRYLRMMEYAAGPQRCRRNALLSLIGEEHVACAGCDVCDGTADADPPGRREILSFVSRHTRRFTPIEAADILSARQGPRAWRGFNDCVPGFAALRGWNNEQVGEAIDDLLAAGALRAPRRGPWKGRLTSGRIAHTESH